MHLSTPFQVAAFPWPLVITQDAGGQASLSFVFNDELVASPYDDISVGPDFYDISAEEAHWFLRFRAMLLQPSEHSTLTHIPSPAVTSAITSEDLPLWETSRAGGDSMIDVCVIPSGGGVSVAQVTTCTGDGRFTPDSLERGDMNARLLASAPHLFNQMRTLCTRYALTLGPEKANTDPVLLAALGTLRDSHTCPSPQLR